MQLADEDIIKFQALYKSELGLEISREEAYERGLKLLRLMSLIYRPTVSDSLKFTDNTKKTHGHHHH